MHRKQEFPQGAKKWERVWQEGGEGNGYLKDVKP